MAGLLSFISDISVKAGSQPSGPLGKLSSTDYGSNTYRYPADLGSSDKNHYMMIQILQQRKSQFITGNRSAVGIEVGPKFGADAGVAVMTQTAKKLVSAGANKISDAVSNILPTGVKQLFTTATELISTLESLPGVSTAAAGVEGLADGAKAFIAEAMNGNVRATTKIESSIALYMPDTLNFEYAQQYSTPSLLDSVLGQGIALAGGTGNSILDTVNNGNLTSEQMAKSLTKNATPFIANGILKTMGGTGQILFAAGSGTVQNPMIEMIYSTPQFRNFQFEFMFYPRDQKEASQVQSIISTLRFHQAPEAQKSTNGYFLVPPSEFDISFYYNGKENPNIPQIGICVLKNIQVNYAPNGFVAYEVPNQAATLGGTGMPVAIQLSLMFEETEIRTKQSYDVEEGLNRSKTVTKDFAATPSPFGNRQGR
jgi:hypothetical protein